MTKVPHPNSVFCLSVQYYNFFFSCLISGQSQSSTSSRDLCKLQKEYYGKLRTNKNNYNNNDDDCLKANCVDPEP